MQQEAIVPGQKKEKSFYTFFLHIKQSKKDVFICQLGIGAGW